jgi:spondin-1
MWIKAYLSKLLLCFVLISHEIQISTSSKCDRTPEGILASRTPSDGRFKLRILGDPDRYIPGENYTSK